ncbi:hypothetical protein NUW54_g3833 [Trametes sanguinea]|uniref:Uncharacterized protein n=1 Tax=Trametes sanguinea TaxID=158606 RepID=A0ACC1Q0X0_9APHY|nr:hypothetical protein NUW54_g3833 [Trametes sanguinea]
MVNKTGKNGRNNGEVPSDDDLKKSLNAYARAGLTVEDRIKRLAAEHEYFISRTTLNKIQRRLSIPSARRPPPKEKVMELVSETIAQLQDPSKGAETIRKKLAEDGYKVPRYVFPPRSRAFGVPNLHGTPAYSTDVRTCTREADPQGHARRKRVRRAQYTPSSSATPPPAN